MFCFILATAPAALGAERLLAEWAFDRPGDFQGWVANGHIRQVAVTNGMLGGQTAGSDPILEYQPLLAITASPWQIIELRMKTDRDGLAQVFWSNTRQGRYGGFAPEKTTDFNLLGDNQWHTYRLLPFWQKEGTIVRLRLDLPEALQFAVDSIRILEMAMPATNAVGEFYFGAGPAGWQAVHHARLWPTNGAVAVEIRQPGDFVLAPPVNLEAAEKSFVCLRLAVREGRQGRLFFATDRHHGLHSLAFPIRADGREHFYNVDMLAAPEWQGRIVALGLQPTDATNATATMASILVSAEPQGPPVLSVTAFGLEEALPRAGQPVRLRAWLANRGGEAARNLQLQLELPAGLRLLAGPGRETQRSPLAYDEEMTSSWTVMAEQPLTNEIRLHVTADHAEPLVARTWIQVTRPAFAGLVRPGAYVPAPQAVRGPYEVGVYYFPGWDSASRWQPVQRFLERKPVLGWYREGLPEVADWHIRWAVEHGITFFAYDWYWVQGKRQLEHALHDGFFKARWKHLLKFCLLWANHNPPKTHSLEDCLAVTRYWITNYFQRPEYFRIQNWPVVIIFSPHNFRADLGSEGTRRCLEAMREECRRAGLPGLYLVACVGGPHEAAKEGYDALTAYNWPGLGLAGGAKHGPFSTLIAGYHRRWEAFVTQGQLPVMLPLSGGWDSRPWHGEKAVVRHDRTPALFREHLRAARQLLDSHPGHTNLLPAILIEAWNEWGEGSYIEPHQEYGFAYLDAIRETFTTAPTAHVDLVPHDVGLGPYEVPPLPPPRTAWTFDRDAEGWENTMHCQSPKQAGGLLVTMTTGTDPALFGPPMEGRAAAYPAVRLRLRLTAVNSTLARDTAQLFWRTKRWPETEATSIRFPVHVDGQWHEYTLRVADNPRWKGVITRLRLDPVSCPGVRVELDEIRLLD